MPQKKNPGNAKERAAKREILKRPGKDDVHEQRERDQKAEGLLRRPSPKRHPKAKKPRGSARSGARTRRRR